MTAAIIRPLVATALLALAAPAFSEPSYSIAKVTIDTRGIDLGSASGRQALDRRVEHAVNAICGAPVFGTHEEAEELRACRSATRAEAEPQVRAVLARMTMASNR